LPNEFHERIRQIAAYQLMPIREGVGLVAKNGWEALKQPYRQQGNGNRTKNPLTVVLHVF
jgi:hypothetical protein